jgi:hypothetical protein
VVATAPQAPRGERVHAVHAHVVGAPHSLPQFDLNGEAKTARTKQSRAHIIL